jgi:hypothetical protein
VVRDTLMETLTSAGVRVDSVCRLASMLVVRVGWRRRWSCASVDFDRGGGGVQAEFPLVWTGSLVDGKIWVVRDTLMETLGTGPVVKKSISHHVLPVAHHVFNVYSPLLTVCSSCTSSFLIMC